MRVQVFIALLFLTVIAGTVPVNQEKIPEEEKECIDEKREFEVATQEKVSLQFKSPENFDGDLESELSSWTISGPDGWTMCKSDYTSHIYNLKKKGSIKHCILLETSRKCYTAYVLLSPFYISLAGVWEISRKYLVGTTDVFGYRKSYKTDNYSVNIYETEFDRRFNNTMYKVKAGDFIVMNLYQKRYENSECRLINRKTNKTYDLNAKEHRFSGKRTGIQKLDGCGFRMQIENKSEGLWSLVGEYGWTRQRADFKLSIQGVLSITPVKIERWWVEDFPTKFTLNSPRLKYWELERPDGKIFLRSNMSHEYINFDQITKDDEGNWKMRETYNEVSMLIREANSKSSMILQENNLLVTIKDLPEVYYYWPENGNNLKIIILTHKIYMPIACVLKNRNGKDLVGTYFQDEKLIKLQDYEKFSFDVDKMSDEERTNEWEFSLNYNHTVINGLIVEKKVAEDEILLFTHVWKSVQRIKYVVRGEEIKVKVSTNSSLTNCTLTNPNNVNKYFLEDNSLITRTKCYGREGFCGCIVTIKNADDTHSGTWNWVMEFEGGRKVSSLAPISVVDSYLITEIEQLNYGNEESNFKFNCRPLPTMHYRKIRYCNWFDSKNHQIFTGDPTKYKEIVENNHCSLELKVSYRRDLNVWKCVAGLDGSSEEEIHAVFDLSKMSFNSSEEESKEKLGKPVEFPHESLSPKLQDNEKKKLPDNTPQMLIQNRLNDRIEKSPEAFDISSLIVVIAILISIVSSCLAICYYVYNKMQMIKKEICEAKEVRKLLVGVKDGPLDPGTMLNEQLDYIRYNEDRWEYPWKNLEFYKEIGRGNFGYVVKAQAENIEGDGKKTQVAVKRISTTSLNYVRALVYELKILSSLTEKHPHIVNLLGACTRDVPKESGGLCVILEYCRCGNLHDFLEKNKSEFVNQFERIIVGQIDLLAPGQINHSNPEDCHLSESGFRVELDDDGGVKELYLPDHSYDSNEIAYNEIDPSRYEPRAFSTGDLMLWGLHVASGMQFLSKNKILHGDLAARNVLLTHSRMAKICDFGLARLIPDGYYQNQINNEVPFKYLAIESLEYKKYSTKTDVWSFGIFLWECFSLGKTPYEELFTSQSILDFLLSGMRLDKPIHSTEDFHQMMLLCWEKDAEDRPTFAELVQKINASIKGTINISDDGSVNG